MDRYSNLALLTAPALGALVVIATAIGTLVLGHA
jgi:hypothetical protein